MLNNESHLLLTSSSVTIWLQLTCKSMSTYPRYVKHGMYGTRFYHIWTGMKQRCNNKNHHKYPIYGGRGISISSKWEDFSGFKNDMYESYLKHVEIYGEDDTQIDREDNDADYSADNCRWVTRSTNCCNRQYHRMLTFRGEAKPLTVWARELGIEKYNLENRLNKYGWTVERALTTPVKRY